MNDFQTYSSRLLSTNADQKDYKEEEKGEAKAGVEVWQTDEAGTGDGPRIQEHSNLDEINAEACGVKVEVDFFALLLIAVNTLKPCFNPNHGNSLTAFHKTVLGP